MVKIDDKCAYLKQCILTMSRKVIQMYELALDAVETNNKETALKVIQLDEFVNLANEDINDIGIEALALLAPVATDLRTVIAGIKISTDLERIGDYAKNIAAFVIKNGPLEEALVEKTRELGDVVMVMLDHTMDAYDKEDSDYALSIPEEDEQINDIFKEILSYLEKRIESQDKLNVNFVPTINMMRNLERAGDHTKNICEDIIYQVKGQHIEFN